MKSVKELFENQAVRMMIQDTLALRNGKKSTYEIAEEISRDLINQYGHLQIKEWGDKPPQPILSAEQRELFLAVEFEQLIKSQRFEETVTNILHGRSNVRVDIVSKLLQNALIDEFCNGYKFQTDEFLKPQKPVFDSQHVVTDIYKEQKDKIQKAIDNLQQELEKAAKMRMTIKLKGTDYPKQLITIESASREI